MGQNISKYRRAGLLQQPKMVKILYSEALSNSWTGGTLTFLRTRQLVHTEVLCRGERGQAHLQDVLLDLHCSHLCWLHEYMT